MQENATYQGDYSAACEIRGQSVMCRCPSSGRFGVSEGVIENNEFTMPSMLQTNRDKFELWVCVSKSTLQQTRTDILAWMREAY
jgi:hypothetical protein